MSGQAIEGLYEKLVESAGDVIGVLDERGIIAFVNSRVEHYPGLTAPQTMGRHYSEFVHPDDLQRFGEMIEQAFSGLPLAGLQFRAVMPDASIRHWVANGAIAEFGEQPVLMAICRDVTESVDLKEKLIARNKALAALSEIAVALSSSSNLDEGLARALGQILAALGLTTGAIILKDAEGKIWSGASTPANLAELSAKAAAAGKLISVKCMEQGERIVVPDVFDDSVDPLVQELCRALGVEAIVSMPLRCGDTTKAVLSLAVPKPADLTLEQTEFLDLAAGILGPAIENATLHSDLAEKVNRLAALGKEAQHRIKNNLQMISGLLDMSRGDPKSGSKTVERCLRQVRAISTVHDMLSSEDMAARIQLMECVAKIADNAVQATGRGDSVELSVTGDDCPITSDSATAVGVIVNELVSNAVEHGFKGLENGRIEIRISHTQEHCTLEVIDDGIGLPEGFVLPELSGAATGLGLVSSLVAHGLGGKLEIDRSQRGTAARITLKGA